MNGTTLHQMGLKVAELMKDRLRVKGASVEEVLRRGAGRLPRREGKEADYLLRQIKMAGNPKLLARMNDARLIQAYDVLTEYLTGADASVRQGGGFLSTAGSVLRILIVVAVLLAAFLYWRGYL
jgi:hypothetical protein